MYLLMNPAVEKCFHFLDVIILKEKLFNYSSLLTEMGKLLLSHLLHLFDTIIESNETSRQ